jgi:hypothetical protein
VRGAVAEMLELIVNFAMVWLLSVSFLSQSLIIVVEQLVRIRLMADMMARSRLVQGGSSVESNLMGFKLRKVMPNYQATNFAWKPLQHQ